MNAINRYSSQPAIGDPQAPVLAILSPCSKRLLSCHVQPPIFMPVYFSAKVDGQRIVIKKCFHHNFITIPPSAQTNPVKLVNPVNMVPPFASTGMIRGPVSSGPPVPWQAAKRRWDLGAHLGGAVAAGDNVDHQSHGEPLALGHLKKR
ncbi:MAG: hypothetical protein WCO56_09310 [Verrucomicrobiota bacterium]